MRKYHLRFAFLLLLIFIFIIFKVFINYSTKDTIKYITCSSFDNEKSKCAILNNDVYMSASHIINLFDIMGYFDNKTQSYNIKQNNYDLNQSNWNYDSVGRYLFFDKYEVDIRSKVKVISMENGVPISSQWSKIGYEYPIQIAQYGLSHYSKWINMVEGDSLSVPLIIYDSKISQDVSVIAKNSEFLKFSSDAMIFSTKIFMHENNLDRLLSLANYGNRLDMSVISTYVSKMTKVLSDFPEMLLQGSDWQHGSGIHIYIMNSMIGSVNLIYVCGEISNYQERNLIFVYTLKKCDKIKLVRNFYVDILKKLPAELMQDGVDYNNALKQGEIKSITLFGNGKISSMKLCNQFSFEKFIVASDWFVENQNSVGGWPTSVTRRIYPTVTIKPGWHSAMAQGHGISLLLRAYNTTGKVIYLEKATKALKLFQISSKENGIVAKFLGKADLPWYEEYPTEPSLFVLNGFLYSLFGLLDYTKVVSNNTKEWRLATTLLKRGLHSLNVLLPLFDSGFGSFYDLRHITFPFGNQKLSKKSLRKWEVPDGPNRARWEYHVIHIKQLFYLSNALNAKDEFLVETAQRFIMYLKGYRSSHN